MPMPVMPGMAPAQSMPMQQPQVPQAPAPSPMLPQGMGQNGNGYDPRNSANAIPSDWNDMAHGAVPPGTETSTKQVLRSMHNAYANKGVNPYDSHPEMKAKWEKAWKDKANRDAIRSAGGMQKNQDQIFGSDLAEARQADQSQGPFHLPGRQALGVLADAQTQPIGHAAQQEAAMIDRMKMAARQRAALAGLTPATRPNVINMTQGLNSNG